MNDHKGSFLLIASQTEDNLTRCQLLEFPDEEFPVVQKHGKGIAVFFCAGCDYGGVVTWKDDGYVYEPFPPVGVH